MPLSTYGSIWVFKWLFTTEAVNRPTSWQLGLFYDLPAVGDIVFEISGSGYSRQTATFISISFGLYRVMLMHPVEFTNTGTTAWQAVRAVGVIAGDKVIAYVELSPSRTIQPGGSLIINSLKFGA